MTISVTPVPIWPLCDENRISSDGTYTSLLEHAEKPVVAFIGGRAILRFEDGRVEEAVIEGISERGLVTFRLADWRW